MDKNKDHGLLGLTKYRAILVSPDNSLRDLLFEIWPREVLDFTCYTEARGAVEVLFNDPPDLLIVDSRVEDVPAQELARLVKSENVYRQLPVIICLDDTELQQPWDWNKVEVDDFLVRPFFCLLYGRE